MHFKTGDGSCDALPGSNALTPASDLRAPRILRCATLLFLSHGYANTSVEDVAIDACVGKPTIYRLFQDKLGLATAVLENLIRGLEADCRSTIDVEAPPEECLVNFGVAYVRWMMKSIGKAHHYECIRLAMEMADSYPDFSRRWTDSLRQAIIMPLSDYIKRQIEVGNLAAIDDPFFMAGQFMAHILHISVLKVDSKNHLGVYGETDIEDFVKRRVAFYLHGGAPRPVGAPPASV